MSNSSTKSTMLIPGAIGEILVSARTTGKLTVLDRYGLKAAILDESLSEDEQRSIDRLLRAVMKGRIAVDPPVHNDEATASLKSDHRAAPKTKVVNLEC